MSLLRPNLFAHWRQVIEKERPVAEKQNSGKCSISFRRVLIVYAWSATKFISTPYSIKALAAIMT